MRKLFAASIITLFSFVFLNVSDVQSGIIYSSVIIDCSEQGLFRAMTPIVKDITGKEIYPTEELVKDMKSEDMMNGGIVTYEKSIQKAKMNIIAGKNPLLIKAVSINGMLKSDPVITRLDAIKISLANYEGKFLNQRKVILVY